MPPVEKEWLDVAIALGFISEREMLTELYVNQEMGVKAIARLVMSSERTVRRRLDKWRIPKRKAGGDYSSGKRKLLHLTNDQLFLNDARSVAEQYEVGLSTVYLERAHRKGLWKVL